jgi:hypothetical protein
MMHLPAILDNDALYFQNNISEKEKLIQFIEECESEESTYGYISPWTTFNEFTLYKTFDKNAVIMSERMLQKCLYIYNSFNSGLSFCKEHYSNYVMRNTSDIQELTLFKSLPLSEFSREQIFSNVYDEDSVTVYLMLNTEITSSPFCLDRSKGIYINPEPGTALMIKDIVDHAEGINKETPLYYIKCKFTLKEKKTSKTDLL